MRFLFSILFVYALPYIIRYMVLVGISAAFILIPPQAAAMLGFQFDVRLMFLCAAAAVVVCCIIIKNFQINLVLKLLFVLATPALDFIVFFIYLFYNVYTGLGNDGGLAGFWEFLLSQDVRDVLF